MKGGQPYFKGRAAGRVERHGGGMQPCPYDPLSYQGRDWMFGWWQVSTGGGGSMPASVTEPIRAQVRPC
jgi:hypothetical protein